LPNVRQRTDGGRVRVTFRVVFTIKNAGRIAAYKWRFMITGFDGNLPDGSFADGTYFAKERQRAGISLDDMILPSLYRNEEWFFGVLLRPTAIDRDAICVELERFAAGEWAIRFRVVSATSPGDDVKAEVFKLLDLSTVVDRVVSYIAA
jgi:hypothetical protein